VAGMSASEIRPPDGTTSIVHLVRHGEVENPDQVLYGRVAGYHLSAAGRTMAKAAADYLAGRGVSLLRSSPLERAVQTAEPISAELGLQTEIDERLIEPWNYFEGMRFGVGDGALRHLRHWYALRNPFRPSWGEPYKDVAARMLAAIADAARTAGVVSPGGNPRASAGANPGRDREAQVVHEAVCVSHQLPIWVTRLSVEGRHLWHDPRRRQCALGSVTSVFFAGAQPTGVQYATPSGNVGGQVAGA
jgi:broad specificity phosphatase PhoE